MTSTPSHVGLRIDNKYVIEAKLGSGGMATVYRATRLLIGDSVAIKILHPGHVDDRQSVERFRREAQAAARLKHRNVVPIYDFGVADDGLVYLVMELVEGQSIRAILKEQGSFAPNFAAEVITQVCSALEAAHKKNVVHRDIKPDNIVVDATPGGVQVKVLDFGIAWMRDVAASSLTETGNVVGTPHYMSPEQCLGEEPDPRSDIYSIGVVLFEMLAGVVPFNARASTAVAIQHVNQPPPSLRAIKSSVPPALEAVVMHALAKQRDQRPQSAALLAAELTSAIAGPVDRPKRASPNAGNVATTVKMPTPDWSGGKQRQRSSARSKKNGTLIWAGAAVVLILGMGGVFLANSRDGDSNAPAHSTPSVVFPNGSQSQSSEIATNPPAIHGVDPTVAAYDTTQSVLQQTEGGVIPGTKGVGQPTADSTLKGPVERAIPAREPEAKQPIAKKTPTNNAPVRGTRDLAARNPAATGAAATNTSVTTAPAVTSRIVNAEVPKVDATKSVEAKDLAAKEATPSNPTESKPNLAALATQAAGTCLSALRSNSVERMSQLYPTGYGQDRTNREKLLARMNDAASRFTVTGSPDVSPAQAFEDSAYTDLVVRLTWRGNFGQTVNKATKFRAAIARTEGDSHISCRIIGKADL